MANGYPIFLVAPPGLEHLVLAEAQQAGFAKAQSVKGGVEFEGSLQDIYLANLKLRGPTRILVRIASFRAFHLAQLAKRAAKVDWGDWLPKGANFSIEVTCRKSKIYHSKAAAQRIEAAVISSLGGSPAGDADLCIKARIEDDLCTISIDTTGNALHLRDLKGKMGKAPIRETLAALCLRACGYSGLGPVVDPMCGSGTFVIEAAEIAAGLWPGRAREFAFEKLAKGTIKPTPEPPQQPVTSFFGFDRDQGAIQTSIENATLSGVSDFTTFSCSPISDLQPPSGEKGLVIVNPPYGGRIGARKPLFGLYSAFGEVMRSRFQGWRVGMVTSDAGLAKASGLRWGPPLQFSNGGIKVGLYQTKID